MLFLDLDGTSADFNSHYCEIANKDISTLKRTDIQWSVINKTPDFFYSLKPFDGAKKFVQDCKNLFGDLTILTGCAASVRDCGDQKTRWVREHLGPYRVACTFSVNKAHMCLPNDILVDDYEKYKQRWLDAGGFFVTHTDLQKSFEELIEIYHKVYSCR